MRKILTISVLGIIVVIGLLLSPSQEARASSAASSKQQSISVMIDDRRITLDKPPILLGATTFVPLRGIFEELGIEVEWNAVTRSITATQGPNVLKYTIGDSYAELNDHTYLDLTVPGQVIEGATMVPLRFIGESFGADVRWDSGTRSISITTERKLLESMSSEPTGNTNSNLNHNGMAIVQGEWVYGIEDTKTFFSLNGGYLYKSKLDGTNKTKLFTGSRVRSLNIQNDWLIFVSEGSIFRMKTDGSGIEQLTKDQNIEAVYVMNDWLLFKDFYGISRMRLGSKSALRVVEKEDIVQFTVSSGWIYYTWTEWNENGEGRGVAGKVKVDGSNHAMFGDASYRYSAVTAHGDYLYFVYRKNNSPIIGRMLADGSKPEDLVKGSYRMNIYDNQLYYIMDDRLYRSELDGSNKQKVVELEIYSNVNTFSMEDNHLFYEELLYDYTLDNQEQEPLLYSIDLTTKETKGVFGKTYLLGFEQAIMADKNGHAYPFINEKKAIAFEKAKEIIQSTIQPGMSDRDKIKALHDYVVLNAAYDYDNYLRDTIPDDSYSEYGILILNTGVCQGYALTMKLLLQLAGIETYYITGTANGGLHAWNMVVLDGNYYHVDATWDDPVPNRPGQVRYNYFLISDKQMAADHVWDQEYMKAVLGN